MLRIFIYVLLMITVAACGDDRSVDRKDGYSDGPSSPEDSLFQEVMQGHDTAMAKMGKLSGYRKQMEQKLDSVKKLKSKAKGQLEKKYEDARASLKNAEDNMNKWMDEFRIDSAQDNIEHRMKYLSDEKIRVEKVRDEIFSALAKADSLINRER